MHSVTLCVLLLMLFSGEPLEPADQNCIPACLGISFTAWRATRPCSLREWRERRCTSPLTACRWLTRRQHARRFRICRWALHNAHAGTARCSETSEKGCLPSRIRLDRDSTIPSRQARRVRQQRLAIDRQTRLEVIAASVTSYLAELSETHPDLA